MENINTEKLIKITFSTIIPESAKIGDFEETGFYNEDGVVFELDEYDIEDKITIVDKVVTYLKSNGANLPSSSHSHGGVWYSTEYQIDDYSTGEEIQYSYHLCNFTDDEQQQIFDRMTT